MISNSNRWVWLAVPFFAIVWIYGWAMTDGLGLIKMKHGYGYYNYLTDAFQHHQLSLLITPAKEVLDLKDPLVPTVNRLPVLHDASYYKGKYYIYWGPVPVLLLFWPARMVPFLPYLPEPWAAMICCTVGFAASIALLVFLIRHFELSLPPWVLSASILNLGLCSPIHYLLRNGDVYHVSIASGYMCLMLALFFLCYGILERQTRLWAIVMGSVFLGFIVGSRPVGVVYAAVLLPLSWVLWHKDQRPWQNIGLLWGPFLFVMGLLGLYNYLRFDSFTNFGIVYQLTPWGGAAQQFEWYSFNNFMRGIRKYWTAPIHFTATFPYLADDGVAFGLIYFSPLIVFLGATGWLNEKMQKPGLRITVFVIVLLACLEMALLSWVAPGQGTRYFIDFAPLLLVAANLAWLAIYQKYMDRAGIRRLLGSVGAVMILYGCLVNLAWCVNGHDRHYFIQNPEGYQRLERFFNSWIRL